MIGVFKNIKPSFFPILMGILISYGYLKMMGINDLTTMFQTIFGGEPLNGIMLKGLFIMIFSLLQYINIDYIIFYIDNSDSLSVRYGSKNTWLKALLKGILIITAVFVILIYLVWLLLDVALSSSKVLQSLNINIIVVIGRIYLFCIITILVQICLLLMLTKTSTYMIMGGISIFLAMTSHYKGAFLNILPQFSSPSITLLNVIVNIVFALMLVVLIKRINRKKELSSYEN